MADRHNADAVVQRTVDGVRQVLVVNGRGRPGGWRVALELDWSPDNPDHAWLQVSARPSRPGAPTGAWVVPVRGLVAALAGPTVAGRVRFVPEGRRTWIELAQASRPWSVNVPTAWLQRFVGEVTGG